MIIYKATNTINNKMYIGQTVRTLEQRKNSHMAELNRGSNYYLHNAIRKHGEENFKWQVICICPNMDILNEQEKYYIKFYNSMNKGYNLTEGGGGCIGRELSEETKEKISKSNRGKIFTENHKQKISEALKKYYEENPEVVSGENNPFYGKHHTDETKNLMRENSPDHSGENNPMYGKHHTPESLQKMSIIKSGENHPLYGKHHSEEAKKKISISRKKYHKENPEANTGENNSMYGKHHSKETKKKLSILNSGENNPMYGRHHSEEARKKISKPKSEETKKKIGDANRGKKHSEETKKKISKSLKLRYKEKRELL